MGKSRLNQPLLDKLSSKLGKSKQYIREQISRRANKLGVSAEAAQVVWCKEQGIATSRFLSTLPPEIREEARQHDSQNGLRGHLIRSAAEVSQPRAKAKYDIKSAIDNLLADQQLLARCKDLLSSAKHHDRAVREATTILDDRLKTLTGIKNMLPSALVGKAIKGDPKQTILEMSDNPSVQDGFAKIYSGVMLAYRNDVHHNLLDEISRTDAMRFCGLIDMLLGVLGKATIHQDRI